MVLAPVGLDHQGAMRPQDPGVIVPHGPQAAGARRVGKRRRRGVFDEQVIPWVTSGRLSRQ